MQIFGFALIFFQFNDIFAVRDSVEFHRMLISCWFNISKSSCICDKFEDKLNCYTHEILIFVGGGERSIFPFLASSTLFGCIYVCVIYYISRIITLDDYLFAESIQREWVSSYGFFLFQRRKGSSNGCGLRCIFNEQIILIAHYSAQELGIT